MFATFVGCFAIPCHPPHLIGYSCFLRGPFLFLNRCEIEGGFNKKYEANQSRQTNMFQIHTQSKHKQRAVLRSEGRHASRLRKTVKLVYEELEANRCGVQARRRSGSRREGRSDVTSQGGCNGESSCAATAACILIEGAGRIERRRIHRVREGLAGVTLHFWIRLARNNTEHWNTADRP